MKVKKVSRKKYTGKVYNIGVENNNNYFANNVLVHNCYQGSSPQGQHADTWELSQLAEDLAYLKVFEVAIGGGEPTAHPSFVNILQNFKKNGIVPNFTTKSLEWLRDPKKSREIIDACGSFGFSATHSRDVYKLKTLLDYNGFDCNDVKPNIHVVLGVIDRYTLTSLLRAARECQFNLTILKFKQVGRGEDFPIVEDTDGWIDVVKTETEIRDWNTSVGIDTPLAAEYQDQLREAEIPDYLYDIKEGGFSCYIDAVKEEIGPSSYCDPSEMSSIKTLRSYEDDFKERYEMIQDAFETF